MCEPVIAFWAIVRRPIQRQRMIRYSYPYLYLSAISTGTYDSVRVSEIDLYKLLVSFDSSQSVITITLSHSWKYFFNS
eukprot:COSAG05_NODE_6915_length_882_cov_0.715198_2_plen_78_part_00